MIERRSKPRGRQVGFINEYGIGGDLTFKIPSKEFKTAEVLSEEEVLKTEDDAFSASVKETDENIDDRNPYS